VVTLTAQRPFAVLELRDPLSYLDDTANAKPFPPRTHRSVCVLFTRINYRMSRL
jgi:hypothetical protein